jgi:hypothetical protein
VRFAEPAPRFHQAAPRAEQISAAIGPLGGVADRMAERRFDDRVQERRGLLVQVPKAANVEDLRGGGAMRSARLSCQILVTRCQLSLPPTAGASCADGDVEAQPAL